MNANTFTRNHTRGGSHGPIQPPKNKTVIIGGDQCDAKVFPTKNIPNFMPEYSE